MEVIGGIRGYLGAQNPKSPHHMILFVTTVCNARCKHCFIWKDLNTERGMTLEDIKKIASSIPNPIQTLIMGGGEPLLRRDLPEICTIFSEVNKTRHIVIPTNGLLTEDICKSVEKILNSCDTKISVQISLDGLENTHDYIRGVKGIFSCATKTVMELKKLQDLYKNFHDISVMTVISKRNFMEIAELNDYVRRNLGCFQNFEFVRGTRYVTGTDRSLLNSFNPMDAACTPVPVSELDDIKRNLETIYKGEKKVENIMDAVSLSIKLRQTNAYIDISKGKRATRCRAGELIGVINANGDVSLCELTIPIGNLRSVDFDFQKLWTSERADEMRRKLRNCSCTHSCFISPSLFSNTKWLAKSAVGGIPLWLNKK